MRALNAAGPAALDAPVSRFASKPLVAVPAAAFLYRALGRMSRLGLRHLGVENENGEVSGIITSRDLLRLRAGERYRLRVVDVHTFRPSMIVRLLRDSTLVNWRAVAKDGMELAPDRATVRRAVQQMGNGETYDFEFTPSESATLRMTVSSAAGMVLATMPVEGR